MTLRIKIANTEGIKPPIRGLNLICECDWGDSEPAYLIDLTGELKYNNRTVSDHVRLNAEPSGFNPCSEMRRGQPFYPKLTASLSSETIHYIESTRYTGDINFRVEFLYKYQHKTPKKDGTHPIEGIKWLHCQSDFSIAHSHWVRNRLQEMEWQDVRLFEIVLSPTLGNVDLTEAIKHLEKATEQYRAGNWKDVLANCYSALESAAKYKVKGRNKKQGFELLLNKAFGESGEQREKANNLLLHLNNYSHLGRHSDYPAINPSRLEAELCLATTIAFFSIFSHAMSKTA